MKARPILNARTHPLPAQSPFLKKVREEIDTALWNVLKPLETTITFLNTGAHPDDERSDLLAYLSRGLGIKTLNLIANRGEGGQNQLGDETVDALGILRTQEMIEASKILGVKAYHLSETTSDAIYDFGIEKTAEATFEKWGEEETYRRFIQFIRTYQPDIIMPSFLDIDSEHGHHRALAILTERAFKDAANPSIFPEQLKSLNTWQIKKLYLPAESKTKTTTTVEIGDFNSIYGVTYPQLGETSRFKHKSQGMGVNLPIEPRQLHLELTHSVVGQSSDLFAGIPYNFYDWAQNLPKKHPLATELNGLQHALDAIVFAYPIQQAVLEQSLQALTIVRGLIKKTENASLEVGMKFDLLCKLHTKEEQLTEVIVIASSIDPVVTAETMIVTRGQQFDVKIQLNHDTADAALIVPEGWTVLTKVYNPGQEKDVTFIVQVAHDANYFHAYDKAAIQAVIQFSISGVTIEKMIDIEVAVLPDVSLTFVPDHIAVNRAEVPTSISFIVQVKNYRTDSTTAHISLNLPDGWSASPEICAVSFKHQLEMKEIEFTLFPSASSEEGRVIIEATANIDGEIFNTSIEQIQYDHIGTSYHLQPATLNAIVFDLIKPKKLKVGYIESGLDKVADALINIDFDVTKLTATDLATGDLSVFDTIVVGIRAYLSRTDLIQHNDRLLKYVENGGNLVVQYHRPGDGWNGENRAPYKLELGNPSIEWRVTDENAKVYVTKPDSTLFSYPNKITDSDWDGWVQERGLYFPSNWDSRFETVVSMADPNEEAFDGGILIAEHGKGTYIYTNLVFYRQIQNEVPGGYCLFTNLLSYGQKK